MAWSDGESAIAPLIASLGDPSRFVRKGAAWSLAGIGEPAVKQLAAAVPGSDPDVRALLIDTLVQIREGATGPLVKLLDHEEPAVRMQAAGALGRINEPEAIGRSPACSATATAPCGARPSRRSRSSTGTRSRRSTRHFATPTRSSATRS